MRLATFYHPYWKATVNGAETPVEVHTQPRQDDRTIVCQINPVTIFSRRQGAIAVPTQVGRRHDLVHFQVVLD